MNPKDFSILLKNQRKRDWLKDIWGKWPGDETIEEIMKEYESRSAPDEKKGAGPSGKQISRRSV
jgi:hypothetical protein